MKQPSSFNALVNLRDVGGLPVRGGGTTRSGVLYRGDAPYSDDVAPAGVSVWPPAAVIDLRSDAELAKVGVEWPEGTTFHHHPIHAAAVPDNLKAQGDLRDLYEFILAAVPRRVAAVVDIVGDSSLEGPTFIHCAAGKDRTGVVTASLLLAAGVEPEAVIADYVATAENMQALQDRWVHKRGGRAHTVRAEWLLAPEKAITEVVEVLDGGADGAAGWLLEHGADEGRLAVWQKRVVQS